MSLIIIDNYDSFTYNLYQYLAELGASPSVYRNDQLTLKALEALDPSQLVVSPGPGNPSNSGISRDAILAFTGRVPILGVCLGHQCIGEVFGGKVRRASRLMHGKTSYIYHKGTYIFANVPSPFEATRYHSKIVEEPLPSCLEVTAFTNEGEIMGLRHREHPTFGVQFHPESILTQYGKLVLQNFLDTRFG